MSNPNKDFREDPKRAIYISGKIDQQLVDKLSPRINELRLESVDPITAYVDSPGGTLMLAETIRHHITAPNPDGKRCRLITVVTSRAASAAADFVALGDYSIAYPYSDLVYHGTRTTGEGLTTELATQVARNLQATNEACAGRLARRAFPRFVLRLAQLKNEFTEYIEGRPLRVLTKALQSNLSPANARLVQEAMKKQGTIGDLGSSVWAHIAKFKNGGTNLSVPQFEGEMLRSIVKYKLKLHKEERWLLSGSGLQEVTEDFNLLYDFYFGSQKSDMEKWNKMFGELFLSDPQKLEYAALAGTIEEKLNWVVQKSALKLQALWYLMMSICRLLQGADYMLPADEAYWLGLIDELPGSGLPCLRTAAEAQGPAAVPGQG
jgi:ATP-dependent protease ClpP protease subunit